MKPPKICILGPGNMGRIIIQRLIQDRFCEPRNFSVSKTRTPEQLVERFPGIRIYQENARAVRGADIVLLAVKPQMFGEVSREIRKSLTARQLVISIMTGIDSATISRLLRHKKVVRCSTNIAIEVGRRSPSGRRNRRARLISKLARRIFSHWGREVFTQQESTWTSPS